jgi:hypothetical protein
VTGSLLQRLGVLVRAEPLHQHDENLSPVGGSCHARRSLARRKETALLNHHATPGAILTREQAPKMWFQECITQHIMWNEDSVGMGEDWAEENLGRGYRVSVSRARYCLDMSYRPVV